MRSTRIRKAPAAPASTEGVKRSQRIHALELKAQAQAHESEIMHTEEDKRRLRVKATIEKDDQNDLKETLAQKEKEVESLTARVEEISSQLEASEQACQRHETQIKNQARDISMLQAEVTSMSTTSKDSAKLLTEKLSLTRELDNLQPEVEHLRTQVASQQKAIAEKLSLERQVVSLEVELEAEKRSKQRALQNNNTKEELAEMQSRVDDLEKKLASEKKEKEKLKNAQQKAADKSENSAEEKGELMSKIKELEKKLATEAKDKERVRKDGERELAEANATIESLEERLETVKIKTRELREELRSTKAQLDAADSQPIATIMDLSEKVPTKVAAGRKPGKKRRADEIEDLAISTPGIAEGKNKKAVHTKPGQKSEFSITPFLNRTKGPMEDSDMSIAIDTPTVRAPAPKPAAAPKVPAVKTLSKEKPRSRLSEVTTVNDVEEEPEPVEEPTKATKPRGRPKKPLDDIGPKSTNTVTSLLDEPEADEESEPAPNAYKKPAPKALKPKAAQDAEQTKKKRKVLGGTAPKTLFDDDDEEADTMPPPPPPPPPPKRTGAVSLAGKSTAAAARGGKSAVGALKKNAFGSSFSPLKKDRRGVGASFLV